MVNRAWVNMDTTVLNNLTQHISCLSQAVIKAQRVFFLSFSMYYVLVFQHTLLPYWFAMKNTMYLSVCFFNETLHIIFGLQVKKNKGK